MAHLDRPFKASGYPHILHGLDYADTTDLYTSASGPLREGSSGGFRKRNGLAVTVTIPPALRAFRYPSLTNQVAANYFVNSKDRDLISSRNEWFKAAKANSANADKAIVSLTRQLTKLNTQRQTAVRAGNTDKVASIDAQITTTKARLASIRANSSARVTGTYSTEFEISDFITALSWSSGYENSFIDVNISLDNTGGLFNYLPEGAKITIWRRKSTKNVTGLYSGKWYKYITCYVANKSRSASSRSDQKMELNCGDRLSFAGAQNYTKKKKWVKDKAHPKGWTPREITLQICKDAGLPVDAAYIPSSYIIKKRVTRGTGTSRRVVVEYERVTLPRIEYDKIDKTDLPSLITGAWESALAELPRNKKLPYSMHMRSGALRIEFLSVPGDPQTQVTEPGSPTSSRLVPMFTDEENIESITVEESIEPESVWTVLKASGVYSYTVKVKGKDRRRTKKVTDTFYPSGTRGQLILDAYGKRTKVENLSKGKGKKKKIFTSKKAFQTAAQKRIDDLSMPKRTLQLDGLSTLGIWPKHYVYVRSRYAGIRGNVWVESVSYSIEEGRIKVSLTLNATKKHYTSGERWFTSKKNRLPTDDRWY